jgi:hypothetical protein
VLRAVRFPPVALLISRHINFEELDAACFLDLNQSRW